ncbi:MAG: hypothetical protein MUD03_09535 [Pirellula sp.]|nr:hypothetical protein [Pirellula sp.]
MVFGGKVTHAATVWALIAAVLLCALSPPSALSWQPPIPAPASTRLAEKTPSLPAAPSQGISSEDFERFLNANQKTLPSAAVSTSALPISLPANLPAANLPAVQLPGDKKSLPNLIEPLPLPAESLPQATQPVHPEIRPSLSRQPAVEAYVPDEDENLPTYPWGGAWWESTTSGALRPLLTSRQERICYVQLDQLVWLSTQYSKRVQSILKVPRIQGTEIDVARGDLDPRGFAQSMFRDTSDPVGNTLTTGGPTRLNDYTWDNSVGIRDRNSFGGKTEFSQAFNAKDSNSLFFQPNNQVDSKLMLNYTQPLMRGAGVVYNTSTIVINETKTAGSIAMANRELQDQTIRIHSVYWELVLARFQMAQAINARARFEDLKIRLQYRDGRDLLSMYLLRAEKTIAELDAIIVEVKAKIRGFQAELALLVGAPEIQRTVCDELIPMTLPVASLPPVDAFEDEYYNAIMYRGDVQAIRHEISVASVQRQLAINELKPTLDLVLEGYVRGLEGDKQLLQSFLRQFDTGAPSYAGGLVYQNPFNNRAARANQLGRALAVEKLVCDFEYKLMEAGAQVYRSVERTKGTYLSIFASLRAAEAAAAEVEAYDSRLGDFFGEGGSVSSILNELIDAEMRLFAAERELATKQVEHMQALIQVKYESGTLMTLTTESEPSAGLPIR